MSDGIRITQCSPAVASATTTTTTVAATKLTPAQMTFGSTPQFGSYSNQRRTARHQTARTKPSATSVVSSLATPNDETNSNVAAVAVAPPSTAASSQQIEMSSSTIATTAAAPFIVKNQNNISGDCQQQQILLDKNQPQKNNNPLNPHHQREEIYQRHNIRQHNFINKQQPQHSSSHHNNQSNGNESHYIRHHYRTRINGGSGLLPGFKATSCLTIVMLVCLETVLLSTVSNCAKTFYMHWNTSNSIFRIDNTDHIIDVNKGNVAFEFDQVHIICPVYEPGTFENETEKYIIYNVSKVEYETCRITNSDPRVIAICDKPQKLMFFTITFRPFTPQPGGLEFLPGNDYYFISTSSKDDLYRRIGGRCSTNNMKVVFKVCCAPESQQNTSLSAGGGGGGGQTNGNLGPGNGGGGSSISNGGGSANGGVGGPGGQNGGGGMGSGQQSSSSSSQSSQSSSSQSSINTNIDHFNRIPIGQNGNTGIRINNMPPNQQQQGIGNGNGNGYMPSMTNINTNISNVVQSTMSWPGWGSGGGLNIQHSTPVTTMIGGGVGGGGGIGGGGGGGGGGMGMGMGGMGIQPPFYPPHHMTSPRPNINSAVNNHSNYSPSHKPTKKTNEYDKHPNEIVKNEELTYNSGASSTLLRSRHINNNKLNSLLLLFKYINLISNNDDNDNNYNNNNNNQIILYNPIIILTTLLVILTNLFNSKYGFFSWWCQR